MPYTVSFDSEKTIVNVQVLSPCTKDDHYEALAEAIHISEKHSSKKILVDLRDLDTEGFLTMRCFAFGKTVAARLQRLRIAHVLPIDPKSREDVRFTSTVASNRGTPTAEFDTAEEATDWLLQQNR